VNGLSKTGEGSANRPNLKLDDEARGLESASVTGHRAFFMVFSPMLESPDWPSAYEEYRGGIVVMNPFNASKATVHKVRQDLDVKVVMYFDTQDIQIKVQGKCLGSDANRLCSDVSTDWRRCASGAMPCCFSYECNAFNTSACPEDDYARRALGAVYKPSWAVNELVAGKPGTPICTYGKGPLGCYSAASNAALVPFLHGWLTSHAYDGVYFDEYFAEWKLVFPFPVDTDGDGKVDFQEYMAILTSENHQAEGEALRVLGQPCAAEDIKREDQDEDSSQFPGKIEEMQHFAEAFERIKGPSGGLSYEAAGEALGALGRPCMEDVKRADIDGDGVLDRSEFIALMGRRKEELVAAFKKVDSNGDGKISLEELRQVVKAAADQRGVVVSEREVLDTFNQADTDGDGKVDFREYVAMLASED
jgi:Ca2+-binding EF-hand superfamily protein